MTSFVDRHFGNNKNTINIVELLFMRSHPKKSQKNKFVTCLSNALEFNIESSSNPFQIQILLFSKEKQKYEDKPETLLNCDLAGIYFQVL